MERPILQGRRLRVVSTADNGEVSSETELVLEEFGAFFSGRYRGGTIVDGYLVGRFGEPEPAEVEFRYVQSSADGRLDSGHSRGRFELLADGRLRLIENFEWLTREGRGQNVFEEG